MIFFYQIQPSDKGPVAVLRSSKAGNFSVCYSDYPEGTFYVHVRDTCSNTLCPMGLKGKPLGSHVFLLSTGETLIVNPRTGVPTILPFSLGDMFREQVENVWRDILQEEGTPAELAIHGLTGIQDMFLGLLPF